MSKIAATTRELKELREAILAEEKAKAQPLVAQLPGHTPAAPAPPPATPAVTPVILPPLGSTELAARKEANPKPRPKTVDPKDAALIIPMTPSIAERLDRNTEQTRWSSAELVMELIRAHLHKGYPAIFYGEQLIARPGLYRSIERNPLTTVLKISSGEGIFNFAVSPENPDYISWQSYFVKEKASTPEKLACQVCLFNLQSYLEGVEDFQIQGWRKGISPEHFLVSP